MKRTKVLLVDDDPAILASFQRFLGREGYDVTGTASPHEALQRLAESSYPVIISDSRMPEMEGVELLEKAHQVSPDTIRILLTGYPDVHMAMEATNRGSVFRFITKPWDEAQVLDILREAVCWHDAQKETKRLVMIDSLTQVYNRRFLDQRLAEEFSRCQRYQRPMAVMMIDLDGLKAVNDAWGHLLGDRVLVAVAGTLKAGSRSSDTVCRFGGDEFVVILPETTAEDACTKATLLLGAIRRIRLTSFDGTPVKITVSIGVASKEEGTQDGRDLLNAADMALLQAKEYGKDRIFLSRAKTMFEVMK